jgi:hypothetical protein
MKIVKAVRNNKHLTIITTLKEDMADRIYTLSRIEPGMIGISEKARYTCIDIYNQIQGK